MPTLAYFELTVVPLVVAPMAEESPLTLRILSSSEKRSFLLALIGLPPTLQQVMLIFCPSLFKIAGLTTAKRTLFGDGQRV